MAAALCAMLALVLLTSQPAFAQTVTRYTNATASANNAITNTATPCSNPLKRTFVVSSSFTVTDVNIGLLLAHLNRSDLMITLVSPAGTRVVLMSQIGSTRDNVNVLFDDSGASSISNYTFNDTITTLNGVAVTPTLTNGSANWVSGNSAYGDALSTDTQAKVIPGAVMEYCILISNSGTTTLTSIVASDTLPSNFTYATGTMTSGSNCAAATTAEDNVNTGADGSDPYGGAISGTALSGSASSLNASTAFALKFRGTVN